MKKPPQRAGAGKPASAAFQTLSRPRRTARSRSFEECWQSLLRIVASVSDELDYPPRALARFLANGNTGPFLITDDDPLTLDCEEYQVLRARLMGFMDHAGMEVEQRRTNLKHFNKSKHEQAIEKIQILNNALAEMLKSPMKRYWKTRRKANEIERLLPQGAWKRSTLEKYIRDATPAIEASLMVAGAIKPRYKD